MSARSRRQTLVRVAEARALVARRAVADDLARIATAVTEADARRDRLAEAGLAGGTPLALAGTTQVRLLRASALREAEESVRLAVQASDASLQAWTEARRSQRLAEELRERERQERAEARQREEQREADELASQRRRDGES